MGSWAKVSSPAIISATTVAITSQFLWGTHSAQNIPEMGGKARLSQVAAYGAIQAVKPLRKASAFISQEQPDHPLPWVSKPLITPAGLLQSTSPRALQQPSQNGYATISPVVGYGAVQAVLPLRKAQAVTTQEIPDHPLPQVSKPLISGSVGKLGQQIVVVQEFPDQRQPKVSGPYLVNYGYLGQQVTTKQEYPDHPRPRVSWPSLPNYGYLGQQIITRQEFPDNPLPRTRQTALPNLLSGSRGNRVQTRQEFPEYYRAVLNSPPLSPTDPSASGAIANQYLWDTHRKYSYWNGGAWVAGPQTFTARPAVPSMVQNSYFWGTHEAQIRAQFRGYQQVYTPARFTAPTPVLGGSVQNWYLWNTHNTLLRGDGEGYQFFTCGLGSEVQNVVNNRFRWGTHSAQNENRFRGFRSVAGPTSFTPPALITGGPVQNWYFWGSNSALRRDDRDGFIYLSCGMVNAPQSVVSNLQVWDINAAKNEGQFRGLTKVSGPTSFAPPPAISGGPVQNWYLWNTHNLLSRPDRDGFIYLSCGLASYADLGQQIWTRQELPDHPRPWTQQQFGLQLPVTGRLGQQVFLRQDIPEHYPARIGSPLLPNFLNWGSAREARLIQEWPGYHPSPWSRQEFGLRSIGYLGQQIITGQELPFHPGNWLNNGLAIPLPTASQRRIIVPQEWPFTGSAPSWTIGPVGFGQAQATRPLQSTGTFTVLEIPGHPLPWTIGGPELRLRLPGFGQGIIILQEWPYVGLGGAQLVSPPVGFGQVQRPLQASRPFTVQELPGHPLPWVIGGPSPAIRLPSGQQISVPQTWPFVGSGGAQGVSGPVGFGPGQASRPLQNTRVFLTQEIPGHPGPWAAGPLLKAAIQGFGQSAFLVQEWPNVGAGGKQLTSSPPLPNFGFLGSRLFVPDQPWPPDHDGHLFFVCGMGNQPADPFWPVVVRELWPEYHPQPWTQTGYSFFVPRPPLFPTQRYVKQYPSAQYTSVRAYEFTDRPSMAQLAAFPPIAPNQVQTMAIDFGKFLPRNTSLVGTPTLTLTVHIGNDPAPQSRVVGGPTVGTVSPDVGGTGVFNAGVIFKLANCLPGATYTIETECVRSDGDIAEGWAWLPCVAPS